jgi:phosphoglycolate phosphatase
MNADARGYWPKAVLFDLDGTLVESLPDLAAALNDLLAEHRLAALPLERVRTMIGNGVAKLVERGFASHGVAFSDREHRAVVDRFMAIYAPRAARLTVPMPGAMAAVRQAWEAGARVAVVTNKPRRPTELILSELGFAPCVHHVVGGDQQIPRKPRPDMVLHALEAFGIAALDAVMVGDSAADVGAAKAAGVTAIAVRGGYTAVPVEELGADRVLASLEDLPAALSQRLTEA